MRSVVMFLLFSASAIIQCSTILVILFYILKWYQPVHPKFPPGPKGIPILGVLPFAPFKPERAYKRWSEKYGDVISVKYGSDNVVILNTYDSCIQAFVKQSTKFSGRPWIELFHQVCGRNGIILRTYDAKYKTQKKFGMKTLRSLGFGKRSMEVVINQEIGYIVESLLAVDNDTALDVTHYTRQYSGNVMAGILFGKRYEYSDPEFHQLLFAVQNTLGNREDLWKMLLIFLIPSFRFLPIIRTANKRFCEFMLKQSDLIKTKIGDHRENYNKNDLKDFIDCYLHEQKQESNNIETSFTDYQLVIYVRDLLMAGIITTSGSLDWVFLCFLKHVEYQAEIYNEVDTVLGKNGYSSMDDKNKMPNTCAFIDEVLRFSSPSSLGVNHVTTDDATLNDYHIPKGTTIISNIWGINNDPKIWKRPEIFIPNRHIKDGQYIPSKTLTFSVGPRHCIGENLARMELFIFFTRIVQRFEVYSKEDLPDLHDGLSSGVQHFCPYYECVFKPR